MVTTLPHTADTEVPIPPGMVDIGVGSNLDSLEAALAEVQAAAGSVVEVQGAAYLQPQGKSPLRHGEKTDYEVVEAISTD